ncbi:hypothetical protein X772_32240 [Mesorhizobium sp. LSJC280B00]|nr:hypothetical protein X772_32240 [Mesorhizobium sp. LSJC280B00]
MRLTAGDRLKPADLRIAPCRGGTVIIAAVGDIHRCGELQNLLSYFGLNPRVRRKAPAAQARRGRDC